MSTTPRLPELPPMPHPKHVKVHTDSQGFEYWQEHFFDAAQARGYAHAYGLAVWKAAIERAATVCDERVMALNGANELYRREATASQCAVAIRALPLPEQGSPQ